MHLSQWTFWRDVIERSIRAAASSAAAVIGSNASGVLHADWKGILSVSLTASVCSVLMSIGAGASTGSPNASMVDIKGDK